jgi:NADH-quinone oxidoreductase subunit E
MSLESPVAGYRWLSPENVEKIERECAKYPQRRAAIKSALRLVQQQHGWLQQEAMDEVADLLGIRPIQVYEVATFYDMFDTESVGRHRIRVCTNVSCMLRGSDDVVAHLKKRLGVGLGETTSDGRITLREAERIDAILDGLE